MLKEGGLIPREENHSNKDTNCGVLWDEDTY